ncbi:virulence-associated E family protein [Aureispira anguillae]|uniref:Virulence-associated E family protein n=1 Tax=Aureispira anguillae TaxID=2864201 RepID=A0A915YH17_9BACT|nr:virulence-associated E family protein [Aureispira anguillae]BDS13018.1 virulence-associated E family protein [Aureispira anguillae]
MEALKKLLKEFSEEVAGETRDYIEEVSKLVPTNSAPGVFDQMFKKWVVASIANLYETGKNTNPNCLVLCGGQGMNKTSFFTSLFSPEYIFIGHIDLKNKDSMMMLSDTFIIVLDEQFSILDKEKDWESLKSAITMPRVKARWHYEKSSKVYSRIANFCGTTNRIEVLKGITNNRRFVPFQLTEPIDINSLEQIAIRKMWGQAYHLYQSGFEYKLRNGE